MTIVTDKCINIHTLVVLVADTYILARSLHYKVRPTSGSNIHYFNISRTRRLREDM